ncbi:ATP-binding protein [Tautonia sociabilis]|uniref:HAMP domain-containing histidine kinase n=1 Tax=Tautonia sociabilis TaxID=2080755 RepID=A0A432MPL2_9BACT|nr:HAMP domain-containing histidine kinase [Tautonia sociabilis]RUL89036.1 HAMP domain-containing histidine kinase [Tautonia sociabilis]
MMGTAGQVDGLAGALLRCVDEPEQVAVIHSLLDRYCHRLRNRLNSMKLSLYLARRLSGGGGLLDWDRAEAASRSIEGLIDQLQQFCTPLTPVPSPGDLGDWLRDRLPSWRQLLAPRPIRLVAEGTDEPLPVTFDWIRLGQGLDGLVAAWAHCAPEEASLRLCWGRDSDRIVLRFEAEAWLARPDGEVESLALPLLARVMRAHRGSLALLDESSAIELSWPSS